MLKIEKNCDFYQSVDSFPVEKFLMKFSKYLLCVPKNASHVAVRGELGIYPIVNKILLAIFKNWNRIINSDPNSLIRQTYIQYCDTMRSPKFRSCNFATFIYNVLDFGDFNEVWVNQRINRPNSFFNLLVRSLNLKFEESWKQSLISSEKMRTFCLFKSKFEYENYLNFLPLQIRKSVTRFRISCHQLAIETGRHRKIPLPVHDRICSCDLRSIEDEFHVIMSCPKFDSSRAELFSTLEAFTTLSHFPTAFSKFLYLMLLVYAKKILVLKLVNS